MANEFGCTIHMTQIFFGFLFSLGYVGDIPIIPPEILGSWAFYITLWVLSFLVSGRIYDYRHLLDKVTSKATKKK